MVRGKKRKRGSRTEAVRLKQLLWRFIADETSSKDGGVDPVKAIKWALGTLWVLLTSGPGKAALQFVWHRAHTFLVVHRFVS